MKTKVAVKEFYKIYENQKEFAEKFSEKNKSLEKFLNLCWDNGVQTQGCCAGHRITNVKDFETDRNRFYNGFGYIATSIRYKDLTEQFALQIMRSPVFPHFSDPRKSNLMHQAEMAIAKSPNFDWQGIVMHFPSTQKNATTIFFYELSKCLEASFTSNLRPQTNAEMQMCKIIDSIYSKDLQDFTQCCYFLKSKRFQKSQDMQKLLHDANELEK